MSTPPNGDRAVAFGGGSGALRAIPDPPPPTTARAAVRGRRLQDGMAIAADVDARVLGLHLLALHADVLVTPARIAVAVGPARARGRAEADADADASGDGTVVVTRARRRRLARAAATGPPGAPRAPALGAAAADGAPPGGMPRRRATLARLPAGDGLAAATRALESGAGELRRARERMP